MSHVHRRKGHRVSCDIDNPPRRKIAFDQTLPAASAAAVTTAEPDICGVSVHEVEAVPGSVGVRVVG